MPWMTIPIATALTTAGAVGGTVASNIYGTRRAAGINERSIAAQERQEREQRAAEERALQEQLKYEREEAAAKERARQEQLAFERERWAGYVQANDPYWQTGQRTYRTLLDLAGVGGGMPAPRLPTVADGPPGAGPRPGAGDDSGPSIQSGIMTPSALLLRNGIVARRAPMPSGRVVGPAPASVSGGVPRRRQPYPRRRVERRPYPRVDAPPGMGLSLRDLAQLAGMAQSRAQDLAPATYV